MEPNCSRHRISVECMKTIKKQGACKTQPKKLEMNLPTDLLFLAVLEMHTQHGSCRLRVTLDDNAFFLGDD